MNPLLSHTRTSEFKLELSTCPLNIHPLPQPQAARTAAVCLFPLRFFTACVRARQPAQHRLALHRGIRGSKGGAAGMGSARPGRQAHASVHRHAGSTQVLRRESIVVALIQWYLRKDDLQLISSLLLTINHGINRFKVYGLGSPVIVASI